MEQCLSTRIRRSQRDYTLAFKISVVEAVERGDHTWLQAQRKYGIQGKSTVLVWLRKLGTLDWSLPKVYDLSSKEKTPEQRIKELEAALELEQQKNMLLNKIIDVAESQFGLSIRKKPLPKQQKTSVKKGK
jgi:Transposase and inactivated derivatives